MGGLPPLQIQGQASCPRHPATTQTDPRTLESRTPLEGDDDVPIVPRIALPRTFTELRSLVLRSDAGDESVRPIVEELILADPDTALYVLGGDLVTQNQRALVEQFAGNDGQRHEAIHNQVKMLREELAGPRASSMELLIIDRILICWLQVQLCDHEFLQARGRPIQDADCLDRFRNRAHRRFLSATRTLAAIRKLGIPAIQINIAEEQINLAG